MGLSKKPEEAENESDHLFNNPHQSCIKLLFFWRPEEVESTSHADDNDNTDSVLSGPNESLFANSWDYFYGSVGIFSTVFIDSDSPRELLSFYLTDLDVRYSVSNNRTRLGVTIGDLQLDNQLENALEPIMVFSTPSMNPLPTVQLFVVRNNARSKINVHSFEHMEFILQELDVKVEDVCILNIWKLVTDLFIRRKHQSNMLQLENEVMCASFADSDNKVKYNDTPDMPTHDSFLSSSFQSISSTSCCETKKFIKKLYIQHLILGSIKLNLSFYNTSKGSKKMSSDKIDLLGPIATKSNSKSQTSADLFHRWSENDDWNYAKEPQNVTFVSAIFPSITDFPIRK